jgi:hypothetical protein
MELKSSVKNLGGGVGLGIGVLITVGLGTEVPLDNRAVGVDGPSVGTRVSGLVRQLVRVHVRMTNDKLIFNMLRF